MVHRDPTTHNKSFGEIYCKKIDVMRREDLEVTQPGASNECVYNAVWVTAVLMQSQSTI